MKKHLRNLRSKVLYIPAGIVVAVAGTASAQSTMVTAGTGGIADLETALVTVGTAAVGVLVLYAIYRGIRKFL